ncbi:unnamed protein product [Rotaria socialis]
MMDPSSLVMVFTSVIQKAYQLYEQKKQNDTDCKYLIDHLNNKVNTMVDFQKMLGKDELLKLDEGQKNNWTIKEKRVEKSLNDFHIWINERNKQILKAWVHGVGQGEEIGDLVKRFDDAVADFQTFLDNMVKYQLINNIRKIADNAGPPKSQLVYELPELVKHIKNKYKINSELANINRDSSVQEWYINLAIVENKEQREKEKKLEKANDISELRGTYEEIYANEKVLVLGRAGIGKSTFCKYVVNRWAQGQLWLEYVLVVLIQLRKLTKERYPPTKMYSAIDLVNYEYQLDGEPSDDIKLKFKKQCEEGQILWILDGYDEFVQNIPTSLEGLFSDIKNQYHHIITTHPYAVDLKYDITIEITGFTDDNITKFVMQYSKTSEEMAKDSRIKSEPILIFLKSNPTIWGIAHIPINLQLICNTWSDSNKDENKVLTVTDLYHEVIYGLCRKYLQRQTESKPKIDKRKVDTKCGEHLQFLENVAFEAIKSNKIILKPELLMKIVRENKFSEMVHEDSLNIGLLKSYNDDQNVERAETEKQHYFIHLSFQEFFAARYLVRILAIESETAREFIQENKYNQRFTLVFIFAFGLLRHKNNDKLTEDYWKSIEYEAKDLVGLHHIKLLIECLDEIDGAIYSKIRTGCISSITTWIKRAASMPQSIVMRHLCDSLSCTTTLAREVAIISMFTELFQSTNTQVIQNIASLLYNWHLSQPSQQLVSLIVDNLKQSNSNNIRVRTCKALGAIDKAGDNNKVIDALLEAIRDENWYVRRGACEALGKIDKTGDNNQVIDALLSARQDKNHGVRRSACDVLGMIDKARDNNKVIDALLVALTDQNHGVRDSACFALATIGKARDNNKVIDTLLAALKDEDHGVRSRASMALGKIGKVVDNNKVIDALLDALKDKNDYVRRAACPALATIGKAPDNNKVIDALLERLKDNDVYVRGSACHAFVMIGKAGDNNKGIDALLAALTDENRDVRSRACNALAMIGKAGDNNTAIVGLLKALKDENHDVRRSAGNAIERCLCNTVTLEGLNHELIAELNSYIRASNNGLDFNDVTPAIFLRSYLGSNKAAWLPLVTYVALRQNIAVTVVENRLVVYGVKGPIPLENVDIESLDKLKIAFHNQEEELNS